MPPIPKELVVQIRLLSEIALGRRINMGESIEDVNKELEIVLEKKIALLKRREV